MSIKPEFDWTCIKCGKEITSPDYGETLVCICGGEMKKKYRPFAFILKGGGFYGKGKV